MKRESHETLRTGLGALALLTIVSGCSEKFRIDPVRLDQHFGEAAKAIRTAQIADPEAAAHPQPDAPNRFDGERGQQVMKDYVRGGQQSQRVGMPTISIGTSGSGGGGGGSGSGGGGGL